MSVPLLLFPGEPQRIFLWRRLFLCALRLDHYPLIVGHTTLPDRNPLPPFKAIKVFSRKSPPLPFYLPVWPLSASNVQVEEAAGPPFYSLSLRSFDESAKEALYRFENLGKFPRRVNLLNFTEDLYRLDFFYVGTSVHAGAAIPR